MIKIEADTLEQAYADAASALKCSVTQLDIELIQAPKTGYLGMFKKPAIIVAVMKEKETKPDSALVQETKLEEKVKIVEKVEIEQEEEAPVQKEENKEAIITKVKTKFTNIMPKSIPTPFFNAQEEIKEVPQIEKTAIKIEKEINELFDLTCFKIEKIVVSAYDDETIIIDFKGEDAALLIGKEGYRYKAISYMLFNWINSKYKVQLRLEIAEFLKNQEESVSRYIESVCETIDNEGRAQTKILDGVLIQIALKELREKYPKKYIVIRSGKDGMRYIIINDYHTD